MHRGWRWLGKPAVAATAVSEELLAQSTTDSAPPQNVDFAADDADRLAILAANTLVDHMDDPQRLRTEALRAFEGSCAWNRNERLAEGITAIADRLSANIERYKSEAGGAPLPPEGVATRAYAEGIRRISEGRADEIDWRADSFC